MGRWGCSEKSKIFKCRFCGTKYCEACGRGDFHGVMTDKTVCQVCFQPKCQGERIGKTQENQLRTKEQSTRKQSKLKLHKSNHKTREKDKHQPALVKKNP